MCADVPRPVVRRSQGLANEGPRTEIRGPFEGLKGMCHLRGGLQVAELRDACEGGSEGVVPKEEGILVPGLNCDP